MQESLFPFKAFERNKRLSDYDSGVIHGREKGPNGIIKSRVFLTALSFQAHPGYGVLRERIQKNCQKKKGGIGSKGRPIEWQLNIKRVDEQYHATLVLKGRNHLLYF